MLPIFTELKPYRKPIIIALIFMFIELLVELWHPLLMAKIIDDGIVGKDLHAIVFWGSIMIAISLLAFLAGIINSFYSAQVSQGFGYDVRMRLFEKVQAFSFSNLHKFSIPSLITRMTNDVTQIQNAVFMGLRIMLRAPLLIVGRMMMALIINVKLGLVLVTVMPFLFFFLIWVMKKVAHSFKSVQVKLDKVNNVMRQNLVGMRLIQALLTSNHEVKRFKNSNNDLMAKTMEAMRLVELTMPVLLLMMNISIVGILLYGTVQIDIGSAQIGEVVAILNYSTRIMMALTMVSFILMQLSRARASAIRINDVYLEESDIIEVNPSISSSLIPNGKIQFDNVSFHYPENDTNSLEDISFVVYPGQTLAILGVTGAGKSSLFQLIPRLYDVNGGRILIDENNIINMRLDELRGQIGYVPQEVMLFSGTIKENINWGKEDASMDQIIHAAKNAQIHETIMNLPNQYDTVIGQRGITLSGGQKQRISIARALIREPKLLLLDDSTSALDLKTEANLLNALKEYKCTTLIITQKVTTAMKADKILLMDDGRIINEGDHKSLLNASSLYQKIVYSQHGREKLKL